MFVVGGYVLAAHTDGHAGYYGATILSDNRDGTFHLRYLDHLHYGEWEQCPVEKMKTLPILTTQEKAAMEQDLQVVLAFRSLCAKTRRAGLL